MEATGRLTDVILDSEGKRISKKTLFLDKNLKKGGGVLPNPDVPWQKKTCFWILWSKTGYILAKTWEIAKF